MTRPPAEPGDGSGENDLLFLPEAGNGNTAVADVGADDRADALGHLLAPGGLFCQHGAHFHRTFGIVRVDKADGEGGIESGFCHIVHHPAGSGFDARALWRMEI